MNYVPSAHIYVYVEKDDNNDTDGSDDVTNKLADKRTEDGW